MGVESVLNRPLLWFLAAAVLGAGLVAVATLTLLDHDGGASVQTRSTPLGLDILYVEFGAKGDTLWRAAADEPARRQRLLSLEHAVDFGVVPSLAPDGARFAYTALPPSTMAPSTDTPALVWLAPLHTGAQPALIAEQVDLLVKPVWAPDGTSLVFRRSVRPEEGSSSQRIFSLNLLTRVERELAFSGGAGLFPIAFAPDGRELLYARIQTDASDLFAVEVESGKARQVGRLAEGLTRDWALSPAGDRLAYLEMTFDSGQIRSRARLLDITRGAVDLSDQRRADEFSPVWSQQGDLAVGRIEARQGSAGVVSIHGIDQSVLAGPARGFDVPLAWSAAGDALAVRSFDGSSALAPGRAVLTLVKQDGSRTKIATGEVTFLGWTSP